MENGMEKSTIWKEDGDDDEKTENERRERSSFGVPIYGLLKCILMEMWTNVKVREGYGRDVMRWWWNDARLNNYFGNKNYWIPINYGRKKGNRRVENYASEKWNHLIKIHIQSNMKIS